MYIRSSKGVSFIVVLIIGLIVGLLIVGVIAFINSRQTSKKETTTKEETKGILLSLSSPADGDVSSSSNITVAGSTGKNAVVVIAGGLDDVIAETKAGKFSEKISLAEGENELIVYAFDIETGESAQSTLSLLYLKDELARKNVLIAAENTNDVTQKNKERIERLKEKLATQSSELKKAATTFKRTHVVGTITSINGTSLTIETKRGDIKNVFTDDFTKFFSVGAGGRSSILLDNLKIGDNISVVGIGKDDTDGSAKFVVVMKKALAKRHAVLGKVKEADGNSLTLTHLVQTDREFSVEIAKNAVIKIKDQEENGSLIDLKVGDVIVAVGTVDGKGTITANKIFVVPGKREGLEPKESTSSATPSSKQ